MLYCERYQTIQSVKLFKRGILVNISVAESTDVCVLHIVFI